MSSDKTLFLSLVKRACNINLQPGKNSAEADGNTALKCIICSNYFSALGIITKEILRLDFE